jgi:hypothetical protein
MAFHLWWQNHDGMRGHAFLRNEQMAALREELLAQGLVCGEQGGVGIPLSKLEVPADQFVSPVELEETLEKASPQPVAIADAALWLDFLRFLEGAAGHGGMRVKP